MAAIWVTNHTLKENCAPRIKKKIFLKQSATPMCELVTQEEWQQWQCRYICCAKTIHMWRNLLKVYLGLLFLCVLCVRLAKFLAHIQKQGRQAGACMCSYLCIPLEYHATRQSPCRWCWNLQHMGEKHWKTYTSYMRITITKYIFSKVAHPYGEGLC